MHIMNEKFFFMSVSSAFFLEYLYSWQIISYKSCLHKIFGETKETASFRLRSLRCRSRPVRCRFPASGIDFFSAPNTIEDVMKAGGEIRCSVPIPGSVSH